MLNEYEMVETYASLEAINSPEFDCETCLKPLHNGDISEEIMTQRLKIKACENITPRIRYKFGNVSYYKCAGNYTSRIVLHILDLYSSYERGFLPYEGALVDQPYKIIQLFQLIGNFKAEKQKQHEKASRRNGRRN